MRLIKQGDRNGCARACVAMLAGTSYAAVRKTYWELTNAEEGAPCQGDRPSIAEADYGETWGRHRGKDTSD